MVEAERRPGMRFMRSATGFRAILAFGETFRGHAVGDLFDVRGGVVHYC